ncbi:MAG TPA: ABC transporter permease [Spirochaetia bacterium]|nr:ABC transporter permease [Spirochaetia bacterium]
MSTNRHYPEIGGQSTDSHSTREADSVSRASYSEDGAQEILERKSGAVFVARLRQLGFAVASLVALVVLFSLLNPRFLSYINWFHITQQGAIIMVLALGQSFVIATAGIDISQGSVLALSSMIAAGSLVYLHLPPVLAIAAALLTGAAAGAVVGLAVTRMLVPPFIATLGMLSVALGAALLLTDGSPIFGLPNRFLVIAQGKMLGFPLMAWIAAALALIAAFILNKTRFGRYTLAIGSNAESARRAGIPVRRHLLFVYVVGGLASAVGGILYAGYTAAALPTAGQNDELFSIAAVVIGGGSLFGGVATILGSVIGTLLMTVLANGSQLAGISPYVEQVVLGLVVVAAVYVDNIRRRN